MFSKIEVNGENETDLYKLLKAAQPGDGESADIRWNFEKFIVDKSGNVVRRFATAITPEEIAESLPEYL
jgi:glutathione peroxidase